MPGIGKDVHPNAVLSKPKRRSREIPVTTTRAVERCHHPVNDVILRHGVDISFFLPSTILSACQWLAVWGSWMEKGLGRLERTFPMDGPPGVALCGAGSRLPLDQTKARYSQGNQIGRWRLCCWSKFGKLASRVTKNPPETPGRSC